MGKKSVRKTVAAKVRKAAKRSRVTGHGPRAANRIPADQGKDPNSMAVGYGKPPIEHRFAPGVSGNPAGTPPSRANLWRYLCEYLEMPVDQVQKIAQDARLAVNRRIAAKQALQLLRKGFVGVGTVVSMRTWDRDEGRPVAHVVMDSPDVLTPEECDEIRETMRRNMQTKNHGEPC